ncbi:hypothetical protein LB504_004448 [Fusarium proliferatum]|nr:hypothetical protein LB504_004448 [Fusarium proliferatum]
MQGKCFLPLSSVSRYCGDVNVESHLASVKNAEPQRLHDVNKDLWQRTFQSVTENEHGQSPTLNVAFVLHDNFLPTISSVSLSQLLQAHILPSPCTPSHYNSASPPGTTGPECNNEPNQDDTPAQAQSPRRRDSRPFSCPDCRTYTTNRKYNLKRHRETRHGIRRHSK